MKLLYVYCTDNKYHKILFVKEKSGAQIVKNGNRLITVTITKTERKIVGQFK